jgi:hypothetical protein
MNRILPIASIATLLLFIATAGWSQSRTPEFGLKIHLDEGSGFTRNLTIGYDPIATRGQDTAFGEQCAPNITPEGDLYMYSTYPNDISCATQVNIMPKPVQDTFTAFYDIYAAPSSGHTAHLTWDPTTIPAEVLSMRVWKNGMFLVDLKNSNSFDILINHDFSSPHSHDNWKNATVILFWSNGKLGVDPQGLSTALIQSATTFPNPMATSGALAVSLGEPALVTVHGYDVTGREVLTLHKHGSAGMNEIALDAMEAQHGAMMLRVEAVSASRHETKTVMLARP